MKTNKILFWTATIIIFLFEGVMPALTSQTELAKESIRHLGYPDYFGVALVVFKVLGALILIIPSIPKRLKEWAYAGFTFDFLFACISNWAVDGFGFNAVFPLIILAILMVSYRYYHKITKAANPEVDTANVT
ncbi:DoxX family protein [Aequorivita todarodis]|uniref:DoxX family protein n=1 Tax=Aequorivita todarodis TaxID=2036821 RepID=UPI0023504EF0|nr:DoxX family protein [Aequorivita todarodis]MDC7999925.1 DoxX family protein [Aequorivita todarodis]